MLPFSSSFSYHYIVTILWKGVGRWGLSGRDSEIQRAATIHTRTKLPFNGVATKGVAILIRLEVL